MRRQLPNLVSISRAIAAWPLLLLTAHQLWTISCVYLILAWSTDYLDGLLAKKLHVESEFGRMWLDPISDALLNGGMVLGLLNSPFASLARHTAWWLLGAAIVLKILKHWGPLKFRPLAAWASFVIMILTTAATLNAYAYLGLNWGIAGLILTIPVILGLIFTKQERISRISRLGY
ncbi:MAG TPA: CDP-alcohol phosphatidyltransferase family protein [Methylomirabilota bacterium]|nr:CDP-alcohol phosphatidyltransferase family protein [Methylomirabilota bacterium]